MDHRRARRTAAALLRRARGEGASARATLRPASTGDRAADFEGQLLRPGWAPKRLAENGPSDRRRLLVIHVPKTGGSSLRAMLEKHVEPEQVSLSTGSHEWVDRSIGELGSVRLFVGHQFLEPLYLFPEDDWVTTLLVRDPLAWWRSYYKYRLRRAQAGSTHPPTFGDFVDATDDARLSNPQASWLLARSRVMYDSPYARPDRVADTVARRLPSEPAAAVAALDGLLSRVTALGTTEQIYRVYLTACRGMGWEPKFEASVRFNRSRLDEDLLTLTPTQEERLLSRNRIDAWLVERARARSAAESEPAGAPAEPALSAPSTTPAQPVGRAG